MRSYKWQMYTIGRLSDVSMGVYTLAISKKVYTES